MAFSKNLPFLKILSIVRAGFFSIATYKSQKRGEVRIFVMADIKVWHLSALKSTLKIDLSFDKGKFWLKTIRSKKRNKSI